MNLYGQLEQDELEAMLRLFLEILGFPPPRAVRWPVKKMYVRVEMDKSVDAQQVQGALRMLLADEAERARAGSTQEPEPADEEADEEADQPGSTEEQVAGRAGVDGIVWEVADSPTAVAGAPVPTARPTAPPVRKGPPTEEQNKSALGQINAIMRHSDHMSREGPKRR